MRIMPLKMRNSTGQRGVVLPLVALLMVVLLGFAAFAVDMGYLYVVKNELQNAADAAALAGASVLFTDNQNCIGYQSPYNCCSGAGSGSCSPSIIDNASIAATATAVAVKNKSGGNPVPAPTVEIGHYQFASSWNTPGVFTANMTGQQMPGWVNQSFSSLNGNTQFINAVRATVARNDAPRFFSAIFASTPYTVTVQSIAYVGFAGTITEDKLDAPIAICKQAIVDDPTCTTNCTYTCVNGRMINSSTGNATSNTAAWTNFTQPCQTANPSNVPNSCAGNNPVVFFGQGMGTVGGQQTPVGNSVESCWLKHCRSDGQVATNAQQCDRQWSMTLPVVDCPSNNPGPCSTLVGAVEVDLIWMWRQNPDMENGPTNMTIYDRQTGTPTAKTWSNTVDAASCAFLPACKANDTSNCRGNCYWNSFVQKFDLKNANGIPPYVSSTGLRPNDLATTMFFLPDCSGHAPMGGTGGENFGILAQYPVLVK
jgi:Flp pilus assembly protein TadG